MSPLAHDDVAGELRDADFPASEIERLTGEGWTLSEIHDLARERGYFDEDKL